MNPIFKNKKGFSLIELLFTGVFLSVIIFGVIKLQTSTIALTNRQNQEAEAAALASEGIAIVAALGKTHLDNNCKMISCNALQLNNNVYALINGTEMINNFFKRSLSIDSIGVVMGEVQPTQDLNKISGYKVTAKVEWTDSSGPHEVSAKKIVY